MRIFTYKGKSQCTLEGAFYPAKEEHAPVLMYIHGGGLIWGSRGDMNKKQIELYTNAGFHVFSIDYRLAPETKLPQIVDDVRDAIGWLVDNGAEQLGVDPGNIAVIGSSAGGYLALLTGAMPIRPKAIVSFYGYGNITGDWYTKPSPHYTKMTTVPRTLATQLIQDKPIAASPIEKRYAIYLYCRQQGKWLNYVTGLEAHESISKLHTYCPVRLVDSQFPPTCLLHGNDDEDVPYEESVHMADVFEEAGISHELITIDGGRHAFDDNMDDPQVQNAFQNVIAFLQGHLQ